MPRPWIAVAVLCFVAGCGGSAPVEEPEVTGETSAGIYYGKYSGLFSDVAIMWDPEKREIAFPGRLQDCVAYREDHVRCLVSEWQPREDEGATE